MNFLSSRAERIAAHLRDGIRKRQWREPLPSTRDWARRLGVSQNTLCAALAILQNEEILRIEKRQGIRLARFHGKREQAQQVCIARVIYYGIDYDESLSGVMRWLGLLSEQLGEHHIQLSVERCSDERLRQLCKPQNDNDRSHELLLPLSIPSRYQQLIAASGRPAIHIGAVSKGIELPFITCDIPGAIRHAVHRLLRLGLTRITLVRPKSHEPGLQKHQEIFLAACQAWPHQPIQAETLLVPQPLEEQRLTFNRFAGRMEIRQGVLISSPAYVPLLMTLLLGKGIAIPAKVEIMTLDSHPDAMSVHPPLAHYPFPIEAFVKTMAHAIIHFFETGLPPSIRQVLPVKFVSPTADAGILP